MKNIFKYVVLILVLFVVSLQSNAQTQRFELSPSNGWDLEYYKDDYSSNWIYLTNLTTESLSFRWRLISNTFPAKWSMSLCDLGSCFPFPPDSNDMDPTTLGGDAYFICHTAYNGIVGTGELKLFVFEIGDEANGDTVTYKYTTTNVVGVKKHNLPDYRFTLFPNPATDILYLSTEESADVSVVEIYCSIGQRVYNTETDSRNVANGIPIRQLSPGIYHVKVLFENGKLGSSTFYKSR